MSWQGKFNSAIGTGLFGGSTFRDWVSVLRQNRFAVHPRFWARALAITGCTFVNAVPRRVEKWLYGPAYHKEVVSSPLFVLGHWRSGTTHLHNLLSRDDRFAFPNMYQVLFPRTFLRTEFIGSRVAALITPKTRFGLDNVEMGPRVPHEDEFALAAMTALSPYVGLAFPRNLPHYDRFLTLRDASPEELDRWKNSIVTFFQKLTWKYQRPLILKSPTHTCRIRVLLELFPDAKFVHIRRHPFDVFRSMKKMLAGTLRYWQLQNADHVDWEARAIRQYREMYDAYFEERSLIPEGRLHELSFEDLEADPLGQVRAIYQSLQLPDFDVFEPALRDYVDSLSGYQKNAPAELPIAVRQRLADEWQFCFEAWGYSTSIGREVAAGRGL
jgi:omega-hydroxy-beta-dihydromenaquinone-9 sulfotransferase